MKLNLVVIFICFFKGTLLFSQTQDSAATDLKQESYIRLKYDNDFFSATDRYYTQGIQLSIIHRVIKYSPLSYALIPLKKGSVNYYGLHFEQDCFTPKSIRYDTLNYLERPFSAVFFVSHTLNSLNPEKQMALKTELDLGVIGPCARCEDEQKAIHRSLLNIQPLGWENQIKTDYIVNYNLKFEKGIRMKKNRELVGHTALRVGTLYTDISAGLTARLGFLSPYFSNLGMDRYSIYRKSNFQFYGILKGNVRAVAYNATLQGGMFNRESVYTISDSRVTRIVIEGMAGFVFTYKRIGLEYSKFYLSKEFKEGLEQHWGRCVITYSF
ncbi:MAG: lipid A deacylase LpxR family protein [Bacteroidota bacterium]